MDPLAQFWGPLAPLGGTPGLFDPFAFATPESVFLPGTRPTRRIGAGEGRQPDIVGAPGWTRSIPCDFIEREDEYVVKADIPGVHKSEIHVEVHDGNVLRFGHNPRAEREVEDEKEEGVFHRAERVSSFRNRNLRMPDDCDCDPANIRASYEDGVLTVTLPKKERREGPREVKAITVG